MRTLRHFLTATGLTLTIGLSAQADLKQAEKSFKALEYGRAAELYEQAYFQDTTDRYLLDRVASSYFLKGDYIQSRAYYQKMYDREGADMEEMHLLRMVLALKASGLPERANAILDAYYQEDQQRHAAFEQQQAALKAQHTQTFEYLIWPLSINSEQSDFAPMFYQGDLVFASSRKEGNSSSRIYNWNQQNYLDLYRAKGAYREQYLEEVESFQQGEGFEFHEASLCFSEDHQTVYFTQNYVKNNKLQVNDQGQSTMRILKGEMEGNRIVNATPLPFNDPSYSCGHPYLGPEGKYLYFSSDMPGGYGQSDLYRVALLADGSFGKPENLGPSINTPGREMFPFLDGNTLYFASDGHFGFGGLDLFRALRGSFDAFEVPMNLGSPINSPSDDFSLILDASGNSGYFASNREESVGDDDIFFFRKLDPKPIHMVSGKIRGLEDGRRIGKVTIRVFEDDKELVQEMVSDMHGAFELNLKPELDYTLEFSREGYTEASLKLDGTQLENFRYTRKDVFLMPLDAMIVEEDGNRKLRVNPIYFVTNKNTLTIPAKQELDKVVYTLKSFPNLVIRIEAHTDSRGGRARNQALSQARAESARDYLVAQGIMPDRIQEAKGFGESRLKNDCGDNVECSDEQHEINRRCDFIVVSQ